MVYSAQSALCVASARDPVGVGEGENFILKGADLTKSLAYVSKTFSEREDPWDSKREAEEGTAFGTLPQSPGLPTAGVCAFGYQLQVVFATKGSEAKQLLSLLPSCCFSFGACEHWCKCCFAWVGRRERRCSVVLSRLSRAQEVALVCSCQSLSVGLNHSQELEVQFEAKRASDKLDRG